MSRKSDSVKVPVKFDRWIILVRVLCLLALGLSGYLLWNSLKGEQLPGCGVETGCGAVLSSRWAYVLGVPVSLGAVLLYIAILAATVALGRAPMIRWWPGLRGFLISAAAALMGAAVWFICLQVFVIGSLCPFCMTAHSIGVVVGILILINILNEDKKSSPKKESVLKIVKVPWILAGLAAVVLMAVAQIASHPKTFVVGSSPNLAERKTSRILQLDSGVFQLDLGKIPLLGPVAAPCVIVHLFDYSCPRCRKLHPILMEAVRSLSNQVALASLPVPLASNCNWLVKRPLLPHTNACAYATAGLAVWRVNPEKMPAFDDWLFTPPLPPSPEAVQAEAMRLVGTNEFNRALIDPWIKEQLVFDIRLYESNHVLYHKDVLPELIIGTNIVSGSVPNVAELYKLLAAQFNVQIPSVTTNSAAH
jgi:uncharacterized membrane protein